MGINFISADSLLQARRAMSGEQNVSFRLNGVEHLAKKQLRNGEMAVRTLSKPLGEMMTTAAVRKELLEKVVLDVELGREGVPILYTPIFERKEDRSFPEQFEAPWAQHGVVVFLEHMEGEEITFGHLQAEQGPTAKIGTYAAGFEYTEDMIEYNQNYKMEELDRAFGEAHNALLNHIHLSPIFSYSYGASNKTAAKLVKPDGTPAANAGESHPMLSLRETLKQGIADARKAKRAGNILLISGTKADHIAEGLGSMQVGTQPYASLTGVTTVISYDGWTTRVGKKEFTYPGVPENKAYLIRPKRGFKELIKHDLLIDAAIGDLSRLVESQIVGRSRRGVYLALEENVQEITLP